MAAKEPLVKFMGVLTVEVALGFGWSELNHPKFYSVEDALEWARMAAKSNKRTTRVILSAVLDEFPG